MVHQFLFRAGTGIDGRDFREISLADDFQIPASADPALQRKIVSDSKEPATEIFTALSGFEVLEEREEDFLGDLLAIGDRQAKTEDVAEEAVSELIEQIDDFCFQLRSFWVDAGYCFPNRLGG